MPEAAKALIRYKPGETAERPWGRWRVIDIGARFCVKRIEVEPGQRLSLQYHNHRSEDWIIVAGKGFVECDAEIIQICDGDRVRIPILARHRISNTGDDILIFIEVQHGNHLDESDIVRVEDDYGR